MSGAAFCPQCGQPLQQQFVEDEGRERLVCTSCGRIHYVNPNIVAGALPISNGRVWLLRRGIEPRYGAWTFPAGFMEMGESVEDAARRETMEEMCLPIRVDRLLNVYSRPATPTVLVVYLAEALGPAAVGHETLEIGQFAPHEIPWDDLAFWNTHAALREWIKSRLE